MCPACLAMGLYVVGGVSAGAGTTFIATRLIRKRRKTIPATPPQGENHADPARRIEK